MTFAYTFAKQDIAGTMKKMVIDCTGATLGTSGNAVVTGLNVVKTVIITHKASGTTTDASGYSVSGGTVTVYAATANFQLTVEGY